MAPVLLLDQQIENSTYYVEAGQSFELRLLAFGHIQDCLIEVHVANGGVFDGVFADFCNLDAKIKVIIHLDGEHAEGAFRVASLCQNKANRTFDVTMIHHHPRTTGLVDCYGIAKDESRLTFTGVSKIDKFASKSNTRQSAKIIVFDPSCRGKCCPILKIDENDVKASHAAVVGKLNDAHLFYLLSRGLNLTQAKKLITQGYLMPIAQYFEEKEKAMIVEAIENQL